jgi:uncharacterized membrane protein YjgN (DUF898 family)
MLPATAMSAKLARTERLFPDRSGQTDRSLSNSNTDSTPSAAAAIAPALSAAPAHRLAVEARFGELYVLFMRNLLLSIGTLSFYRFWGRAGIRRYLWSRVSVGGDAFEYAGTGRELFRGFLAAFVILGLPLIALGLFGGLPEELLIFVVFVVLWLLRHFAKFGAHRYRMTRTHWRGIGGSVDGSAFHYGLLGIGLDLLMIVSLGWTKPWSDTVLLNYRINRSWAGTAKAECTLGVGGLYGRYAASWFIVTIGVGFVFYLIATNVETVVSFDMLFLETVLLYLVLPVIWTLGMGIYNIALLRNAVGATTLAGLRFRFAVSGLQLAQFRLANYFILIGTVGLGLSYVLLRQVRFAAQHLEIAGPLENLVLAQREGRRIRGEGLAQYLGLDNF